MNTALVSAFPVMLGSVVGAATTIATAWISQHTQARRELLRQELRNRERLYGEFIGECSRLAIDALAHGMEQPETLWTAYALLNRIRLAASEPVLHEAERVLSDILTQYASPNLSMDEFRKRASSRESDPLKSLGQACRTELRAVGRAG